MIDKYAPIVPFVGMGGLRLDSTKEEVEEILGEKLKNPEMHFDGTRSRYAVQDVMLLFFEEKTGRLIMIYTQEGYKGKLFGKIGTDSTVEELMRLDPSFVLDEFDELYISKEKGVAVDAVSPENRTKWISVYVRDIDERCRRE